MRWRKCVEGCGLLKLQYAFCKERLEALAADERFEEAALLRLKMQEVENLIYEEYHEIQF